MLTTLLRRHGAHPHYAVRWFLLLVWLTAASGAWAQSATIGSTAVPVVSPATSSYLYGPIYRSAATSTFNYSRYAHLYTPAELGIPAGVVITQLAWLKTDAGELTGNNVFNVLLGNSTATGLATGATWAALSTGATAVYSSTTQQFTGAAGTYVSVTLNQPFTYTGGNLLVLLDHEKQGTATAVINFVTNLATGFALGFADSSPITATTPLVTSSYGNRRPTLRITYTSATACTAPPTAGTTLASATAVCSGSTVGLSLQGASFGMGLTYQWQQSTNGTTYTDIAGATSFTYTTPVLTATRYYRARLTCSGQSATSTPAQVTVSQPTYAALPVVQSFENAWLNACNTNDAPNSNWRTNPGTGNTAWRRDDDGVSAAWTSPTLGIYTPTASQGSRSARFHSYYAGAGGTGSLDLYVNMSQAGSKRLVFDYVNTAGNDSLLVSFSNDGGVTFGAPVLRLGVSGTAAQGFRPQSVTLTGTSATTVVRFTGKVTTTFTSDIGLDDVRLESLTSCLLPTALAVTGTTATSALVSWNSAGTGNYTVFYGPVGFTPGGTGSQQLTNITGTTATITGLTASTNYEFYVRQNCGSTFSGNAGPVAFRTDCTPPPYATLPVTENFENTWLNRCNTRDVPTNTWRNTPFTGNNSWRREDDGVGGAWVNPNSYGYTPTASQGTHSARFHSGQASSGLIGTLDLFVNLSQAGSKQLSFDFFNTSGTDSLTVHLSTDGGVTFGPALLRLGVSGTVAAGFSSRAIILTSTSATAVVRFRGRADFGITDIGLDNIRLESTSGCLAPTNLATTAATTTTAIVTWQGTGTGTYTVQYGPAGFTPGQGTTLANVTSPYTITSLQPGTQYQFYVSQNCGATQSTLAGPVRFTTQIINDDPCGAIALTLGSDCTTPVQTTNAGATTTTPNGYTNGGSTGCGPTGLTLPKDVWFKFRTAASGRGSTQATLTVTGTVANVLRVFTGTACTGPLGTGPLTPVTNGCAASGSSTVAAPVLALTNLTPNTDYYVQVSGYSNAATLGNFTMCAVAPSNCPVPVGLAASATTATAATLVWAVDATTPSGTFTLEYGPRNFAIGTGSRITGITGPTRTLTGLTANTEYCFYVRQECNAASGTSAFSGPVCFRTALGPASNDEPCAAIALTVGSGAYGPVLNATNIGATTTTPNGYTPIGCSTASAPKDVWFTCTTPAGSTALTLLVTGNPAGQVRVFSAASCNGPFTQLACQAGTGPNTPAGSFVVTGLTANTTYYVSVSGFGSNDFQGGFTMQVGTGVLLATGQGTLVNGEVQLYPNPSHEGVLNLAVRGAGTEKQAQALLFNSLGQQVLTQAVPLRGGEARQVLAVSHLAKGFYTLRLRIGQTTITRKVVLD